jgi:hypothetical protein
MFSNVNRTQSSELSSKTTGEKYGKPKPQVTCRCEPNSDDFFLSTVLQDFFVTLLEEGSFLLNA